MNSIVYAYKHKDYEDVFLLLNSVYQYPYFKVVDNSQVVDSLRTATLNYQLSKKIFDRMFDEMQEECIYRTLIRNYTDQDGYTGKLAKRVELAIKDFTKTAFNMEDVWG